MRIAITGAEGLIGSHIRCYFKSKGVEVVAINKAKFNSDKLNLALQNIDTLIHLAGVCRGQDIYNVNMDITDKLISAIANLNIHVIFANSVKCGESSEYGQSKKDAFIKMIKHGIRVTNLILPHVFGEGGKPFYNSALSTFCYNVANNKPIEIRKEGVVELIHCSLFMGILEKVIKIRLGGDVRVRGEEMTIIDLAKKIKIMGAYHRESVIPNMPKKIDICMFNTLRSYFPVEKRKLKIMEDDRGSLFEAIKTLHGGQCSISRSFPKVVRGNHYHLHKIERFVVIQGQAKVQIRHILSDKIVNVHLLGNECEYIDIPTLHTHNIINTGTDELILLFYTHDLFDLDNTDTYYEEV